MSVTLRELVAVLRAPPARSVRRVRQDFTGLTCCVGRPKLCLVRETHRDGHMVHVRPELVVEVDWSDVRASPRYPGGSRVRRCRPDKRASEADTLDALRAHLARQRA